MPFLFVGLDAREIKFDGDVGNLFDNFGYFGGVEQFALHFGAGVLVEVLHHGFEQPGVDFEFLECLREVNNFVDILDFGDPARDQLVLLVKLANVLEVVPHLVLIDILEGTFGAQAVLEGGLDERVAYFDFLLHVFGDGVLEGGEFHVDLDDVVVGEVQQLMLEKESWGEGVVEEGIEMRVDDNFLLPVLHGLLVFINAHADILNICTI